MFVLNQHLRGKINHAVSGTFNDRTPRYVVVVGNKSLFIAFILTTHSLHAVSVCSITVYNPLPHWAWLDVFGEGGVKRWGRGV